MFYQLFTFVVEMKTWYILSRFQDITVIFTAPNDFPNSRWYFLFFFSFFSLLNKSNALL